MTTRSGAAFSPYKKFMKKSDIDAIARETGLGNLTSAYLNLFQGINHRGLGNPVPTNQDNPGIIFFTKPDLNLSYDNLASIRTLMPLATQSDAIPTIQRAIRTMLDPRRAMSGEVTSPLVDPRSPFLTLLTNNLISLSGWPDPAPDVYVGKEGVYKENWFMLDGTYKIAGDFDLSASFRNIQGNPVSTLFAHWLNYATGTRLEDLMPYTDNIVANRLDSTTRIYHFVMDPSRRFVQATAATGYSAPQSVSLGAQFNFNGGEGMSKNLEQVSTNFKCAGVDYNDPITMYEFNELVGMFAKGLRVDRYNTDGTMLIEGVWGGTWKRIEPEIVKYANYIGLPLIHPITNEMMWFCQTPVHKALLAYLNL